MGAEKGRALWGRGQTDYKTGARQGKAGPWGGRRGLDLETGAVMLAWGPRVSGGWASTLLHSGACPESVRCERAPDNGGPGTAEKGPGQASGCWSQKASCDSDVLSQAGNEAAGQLLVLPAESLSRVFVSCLLNGGCCGGYWKLRSYSAGTWPCPGTSNSITGPEPAACSLPSPWREEESLWGFPRKPPEQD